jgi:ribosomal protein L32
VINTAIAERQRLDSGRSQLSAVVTLLVLAGVGVLLALTIGAAHSNGVPTCDGRPMTQDDVCSVIDTHSGGGTFGYDQMADRDKSKDTFWRVAGWGLAGVCAVLVVPVAAHLDPSKQWGQPVATRCPRCGEQTLRERLTTHSVMHGRTTRSYRGIATLCVSNCGYAVVRRP